MKNLLTFLSIASLSTFVVLSSSIQAGQEQISDVINTENSLTADAVLETKEENAEIAAPAQENKEESTTGSQKIQEQKDENTSNLWEMLDTNKDGALTEIEAAYSKEVFASWDRLDVNNDKKLDTEEFAHIYSLKSNL